MVSQPSVSKEVKKAVTKALVDPFTKLTAKFDFASDFSIFEDAPEPSELPNNSSEQVQTGL